MEKTQLQITAELSLEAYIDAQMGLLLTGEQVAKGMGIDTRSVLRHKQNHDKVLKDNKHHCSRMVETAGGSQSATLWTLRGIMRLERFVNTTEALTLGSWAEQLIFDGAELDVLGREDLLRQEAEQQSKVDKQQDVVDELTEVIKLKELKEELSKIQKRKRAIDKDAITGMQNLWQQGVNQ